MTYQLSRRYEVVAWREEYIPWLLHELELDTIVTIAYTKDDGTKVDIKCTRNLQMIPPDKWPEDVVKSDEICQVYNVETRDWVSFRFDSVVTFRAGNI